MDILLVVTCEYIMLNMLMHLSTVVDVYNLSLTCSTLRKAILHEEGIHQTIVIRNLTALIKRFGFDSLNIFNRFLYKNKLSLSGSLFLQSITGDVWDCSDMDLYLHTKMAPEILENIHVRMLRLGYESRYCWEPYGGDVMLCAGYVNKNGHTLQVIISNEQSMLDVVTDFDVGFVANYYQVHKSIDSLGMKHLQGKIKICHLCDIIDRRGKWSHHIIDKMNSITVILQTASPQREGSVPVVITEQMTRFLDSLALRKSKYGSRGFHLATDDSNILAMCRNRLHKYIKIQSNRLIKKRKLLRHYIHAVKKMRISE
jgi:Zn-finger protein